MRAAIAVVTLVKAAAVLIGPRPDVWEDGRIAAALANTGSFVVLQHGVVSHTLQFPVYPSFIAAVYRLGGVHPKLAALANVAISGVTAWLLLDLFGRLFDRLNVPEPAARRRQMVAGVATLAFLVHPLIAYYTIREVHPFTMDVLCLFLPQWLLVRYFDRGEQRRDLWLFTPAAGVAILDRAVLGVCLIPLFIVTAQRAGAVAALRRTIAVAAGAFLIGVPWLVHNYRTDGIVGYTSTTAEILWKGALPNSEGSNWLTSGEMQQTALTLDERARIRTMSISEQAGFFRAKYGELIRTQPLEVLRLFAVKLRNFFWFRSLIGSTYSPAIRRLVPIYQVGYAAVLTLALVSVVTLPRSRAWIWSVVAGLGLAQSVFYVETRHRLIIEPLLVFLAIVVVVSLFTRTGRPEASGSTS